MVPQIRIEGLDAFEDIDLYLRQFDIKENPLEDAARDFVPEARSILLRGRTRAALRGTDKDGQTLLPITRATAARRRRAGKGPGPAMAPDGASSSTVADFQVTGQVNGGRLLMLVDWPNSPWVGIHARGVATKLGTIVRDIAGVDPETLQELTEAFADHLLDRFGQEAYPGRFRRAASRILGRFRGR